MTKEVYALKIDPELKELLPPLTNDETKHLEESLLTNGCQNPIFTWNGYIADGHTRYNICQKHNIPFEVIKLAYDDKSEVMRWMIDTQLGRRNLSPMQRVAVTEKYRPMFEKKARENQGLRTDLLANLPKSDQVDTRKELSKLAGVGERTYGKAAAILSSDNNEVKTKVLNGEKSIDAGYNEIKQKTEKLKLEINRENQNNKQFQSVFKTTKKCLKCKVEKSIDEFADNGDFCKECMKHINEPILDNSYIDTSTDVGKIVMDLKTPKIAADYVVVAQELLSIKESISESIETAEERIFDRYDLPSKMTNKDKENAISYMNQLSGEILKLKNKIEKIIIKGENN